MLVGGQRGIPPHTTPHHTTPHHTTPHRTTPRHATPRHAKQHTTKLHRTTSHHTTPNHSLGIPWGFQGDPWGTQGTADGAQEIEEPFGLDSNDLPLAEIQASFNVSLGQLVRHAAKHPPNFGS